MFPTRYSNLTYADLDPALVARYPIDDVWCESRRLPTSRAFSFRRNGKKLMLIIRPDASRHGGKSVRFACSDPKVGCVLYKMYVTSAPVEGKEASLPAPAPKRNVSTAIAESSLVCRATPVGALFAGHALYVTSVAYLRRVLDVNEPMQGAHESAVTSDNWVPPVEELRRFVNSRS